jgi:hypothetical protein
VMRITLALGRTIPPGTLRLIVEPMPALPVGSGNQQARKDVSAARHSRPEQARAKHCHEVIDLRLLMRHCSPEARTP